MCELFIDQHRYVGDDPIGHGCYNHASYELKSGYLICEECFQMLQNEPERITWPSHPKGIEGQKKIFKSAMVTEQKIDRDSLIRAITVRLKP